MMTSIHFKIAAGLVVVFCIGYSAQQQLHGQDSENRKPSADEIEFFESNIRPVLVKNCYGCHSEQTGKARGGLIVDTKVGIRNGGDSGEGIVPGSLEDGTLWSAINYEDWEMPPGRPLKKHEIDDIEKWILMGAPDPRVAKKVQLKTSISSADIRAARKNFWAYQSPKQSDLPKVEKAEWVKNDVDHFTLSKLEQNELSPSDTTDADTFLKRVCNDLTGLPPTLEQLSWFRKEWKRDEDKAVEYVVNRLLDSDRFGERWGRHWLDVARYAESTGKELNAPFFQAWRYRDYVIDAFNSDKPYDEFIREQIAGDLLRTDSDEDWTENLIATGFLAMGPKTLAEQNPRQFLADLVDEQIDTTTRVILGTSVACARCHDHKFDPIPQTDYYAMAGIFMNTKTYYGTATIGRNRRPSSLIQLPVNDPDPKSKPIRRSELAEMKREIDELEQQYITLQRNRRLAVRGQLYVDGKKVSVNDPSIGFAMIGRISSQISQLDHQIKSVDQNGQPASYCMGTQPSENLANARLLVRGELNKPAQEVKRGFVSVLSNTTHRVSPNSSGRLELAKWLSDEQNPLTARVMVNRIWQHMFGQGIVTTPENFGATGQSPSHPELLDWLAVEFMNDKWSIKSVVRTIANSNTYRMSSQYDNTKFESDPENRLLWRMTPRRLDAESIRDAMLMVSGNIDFEKPRGSQLADLAGSRQGIRTDGLKWDETVEYRSVYLPVMRDRLPRVLEVFDFAEPSLVVGQRETSNTPAQALYLLNNEFVLRQSEKLAARIMESESELEPQIKLAFQLVFGREASAAEVQISKSFFQEFESTRNFRRQREKEEMRTFCQSLFASAEFRILD